MYAHTNKVKNNMVAKHHVVHTNFFISKIFWFWKKISYTDCVTVHFNFSSVNSLLFLLLCIKKNRRWVLMLHNGKLSYCAGIKSFLIKLALKRFDVILALSPKQEEYYANLNFKNTTVPLNSYLPPVIQKKSGVYPFHGVFEKFDRVILGSGYSLEIYRFDFLIEYARLNPMIGVIVVTYGNSSKDITDLLNSSEIELENFFVFDSMAENEFLYLQSMASAYVRPNDVDSFGIACADSILLNTPVVASDVCSRFEGCTLFKAGDYSDFSRSINKVLNTPFSIPEGIIQREKELKIKMYTKAYQL
jgi:hypothetical protein